MTQEELLNIERKLEGIAPEGWVFEPNSWDTASVRLGPKTVARFTVLLDNEPETDEECRHADECAELAHAQAEFVARMPDLIRGLIQELREREAADGFV